MARRRAALASATAIGLLLLAGCAAGANPQVDQGADPAGFWLGLWHGVISPITFVISLFDDDVSLYEVANNGNWYDFGFIFGVSIVFSGSGGGAKAARRR